jgi:hypothetical protein
MGRGLVCLCVGVLLSVGVALGRAPAPPTGPVLDKAIAAEVRKLLEERRTILRDVLDSREKLYQLARAELGQVLEVSKRLLAVELELATTAEERVAAYERCLEKAQAWVAVAKAKKAAGRGTEADVQDARDRCLELQIGILKAGGKLKKAEK